MKNRPAVPLETLKQGDPTNPVLFFVHGWPDEARLWQRQLDALSDQFYCIAVTLPNMGEEQVRRGGYDFPELVELLAGTIRQVSPQGKPVHLVSHDWGAYVGYMLERNHPELIVRMVALDVGGHARPETIRAAAFTMAYQWSLILFWIMGGAIPPLGNGLARLLGRFVRVPRTQRARLKSRFGYFYFYFWRGMFFKRWKNSLLGHYEPGCPVCYLYGAAKPVMFHSRRWLQIVESGGGSWKAIEGAGHWFMQTHPGQVNQAIREWCSKPQPEAGFR